ncbi:MAG: NYN domain-containing protein [Calditrichaeota bacterium]|nr:NYN domain-containing protein [Calditrichota bacterium]
MTNKSKNLALYCDFENIALGVRDAKYARFDITEVLERLLVKGNIVVKKAYCDWDRYKDFKADMHEASFELIEIPHVRQSGKNSADIRLVVDALDLCYTKSHVDTFVVISGDSDFSPLVSKLRENNKIVIGVGVKESTSNLLIANCDEFIYYDDIIRQAERRKPKKKKTNGKKDNGEETPQNSGQQQRREEKAFEWVLETMDDLFSERDPEENVWGSMVKQALKRRKPGFSERYHGFRSFSELLEKMEEKKMVKLEHDQKSGGYIIIDYIGAETRVLFQRGSDPF